MSASLVRQYLAEHLENVMLEAEHLPEAAAAVCQHMVNTLLNDGRLVVAGFNSQHLVATRLQQILLQGFQFERPPLPTLLLDSRPEHAQLQLLSLVTTRDLLIFFSATASSLPAPMVQHLRDQRIPLILVGPSPEAETAEVTESLLSHAEAPHKLLEHQLLTAHALGRCVEQQLFGGTP